MMCTRNGKNAAGAWARGACVDAMNAINPNYGDGMLCRITLGKTAKSAVSVRHMRRIQPTFVASFARDSAKRQRGRCVCDASDEWHADSWFRARVRPFGGSATHPVCLQLGQHPVMASFNTMSSLKLHAPMGVGQVRIARGRTLRARTILLSRVRAKR